MYESRQTIARLLAAFANALDSMSDREYDLLIQGKATLGIVKERKPKKKLQDDSCLDEEISELVQKLHDAESREVAKSLLASIDHPKRKEFLIRLARACKVRVTPKDNIAKIEQKLVENVVGSKLRSQAIRKVPF